MKIPLQPKTFYLAGPSARREDMADYADDLKVAGWRWAWNWTQVKEGALVCGPDLKNATAISLARPGLVLMDLTAAASADVFVLFMDPKHHSFGGAVELGTRLQAGRRAVVCTNGIPHHLFLEHPLIDCFPSWNLVLEHLGLLDLP